MRTPPFEKPARAWTWGRGGVGVRVSVLFLYSVHMHLSSASLTQQLASVEDQDLAVELALRPPSLQQPAEPRDKSYCRPLAGMGPSAAGETSLFLAGSCGLPEGGWGHRDNGDMGT